MSNAKDVGSSISILGFALLCLSVLMELLNLDFFALITFFAGLIVIWKGVKTLRESVKR